MTDAANPRPSDSVSLETPTILIRTLNEVGAIESVLRSIPREYAAGVLVVDGGSTDGTVETVRASGFQVLRQEGRGLGKALLSGIRAAQSDIVLMMCGDGSYSGEAIPRLLAKLEEGYDVVVGSRYSDGPPEAGMFSPKRRSTSEDDTLVHAFGNRLFSSLCQRLLGLPLHDVLNGVKGFRRSVYDGVAMSDAGHMFDLEMLLLARQRGYRLGEIPIHEKPRQAGVSKVNVLFHGSLGLALIVEYWLRGWAVSHQRDVREPYVSHSPRL